MVFCFLNYFAVDGMISSFFYAQAAFNSMMGGAMGAFGHAAHGAMGAPAKKH